MSRLVRDEGGATAIEYGLMAAMLAVVVIACVAALTPGMDTMFSGIVAKFPTIS
ncbi:MAG TPA: Flp family type IVb pilin [Caulobacteraceae bacterium]